MIRTCSGLEDPSVTEDAFASRSSGTPLGCSVVFVSLPADLGGTFFNLRRRRGEGKVESVFGAFQA